MQVVFNGQLLSSQDPQIRVSPFANAVQFGSSVFETFRTHNGVPPANIKAHWERLFASANTLKITIPSGLNQAGLDKGLALLLNTLDLKHDYRCKVLMNDSFWWIKAEPLVQPRPNFYEKGVEVTDVIETRDFPSAKYASPLYPFYQSFNKEKAVFETLYFSPNGDLLEGSVCNVIAVIGGVLRTPQDQVLPGVTVRQVLRYAVNQGLSTNIGSISKKELQQATEILLTNSVKGLVPVRKWDDWERSSTKVYDQLKIQFEGL